MSDNSKNTLIEIDKALKKAGRLETRPLAVYGSETILEGSVSMSSIDQCTAKTIQWLLLMIRFQNSSWANNPLGGVVLEGSHGLDLEEFPHSSNTLYLLEKKNSGMVMPNI
ncbi:hypothetical protein [Methanobacterium spitsbergense]|uniref:hypothetical protein n=1 Tax=Methanobacterium spitsbergense TaxID=2874285 RepID=UPI001CBB34A3